MNWVRGLLEGSSLNKLSMVIGNFFVQEVVVDSFFYCEWGSVQGERVGKCEVLPNKALYKLNSEKNLC